MAELKIQKNYSKKKEVAVFKITYQVTVGVDNIENSVQESGTTKISNEFTGRTDEDLVYWIREIINELHGGSPVEFIYDWELTLDSDNLLNVDIKLEK